MANAELRSVVLTAGTTNVLKNEGAYVGYVVTVVTATGEIRIYDSLTATAADLIDVIPIAAAVGSKVNLSFPIKLKVGLTVEFNGGATGSIRVFYN